MEYMCSLGSSRIIIVSVSVSVTVLMWSHLQSDFHKVWHYFMRMAPDKTQDNWNAIQYCFLRIVNFKSEN